MCTMNISLRRVAAVCAAGLLPLLSAAGATAGGANASPAQQRQIAETTLTSFKVVLTATRVDTGLQATVTAAGYQNSAGHWKLIGQKRIGAAGQWFWYSTEVCGLTVTELKPLPSSAAPSDTLTVSLLMTPALGCSGNISASWGLASPPPARTTVYVVNRGSNTVTPINAATGTVGTAIGVGRDPVAIAITPNHKTAYVVNYMSGTVTPISTATNTAGKAIKVGTNPYAIAITPNGKTAYVANSGAGTVTPISTATNTAGKPIKTGLIPRAIAITPASRTAYVANAGAENVPHSATVTPIRVATNTAGKPIGLARPAPSHRDHPERQDRLRLHRPGGHRGTDQHRHQHRGQADQHRRLRTGHHDHPGRQDRLRQ